MSLKSIPNFTTEKAEHEFWSTHSSVDYETEAVSEDIKFDSQAKTEQIQLRVPRWLTDELRAIAADEGIPYQRLIKNCLKEFVIARQKSVSTDTDGEVLPDVNRFSSTNCET
jgi:predicted DNA binding CopG/RHH family protein